MNLSLKTVLGSVIIICFMRCAVSANGDIFENIDKGLRGPQSASGHRSYFADLFSAMADSQSYIVYKELYLSGRYSSAVQGNPEGRNSAGLIIFGTFSGPEGQLGDLNIQLRSVYYNDQFRFGKRIPRDNTERLSEYETEWHNAFLDLRAVPPMLNVRFGHFYVPYGIQPWIDTHGTLLQSPAMDFIGEDRDWGVAISGQNDILEYEAGLSRGSGMEYFEREGNYVLAGKVSTPRIGEHVNDWLGISFLTGKVFDPMAVQRLRTWSDQDKEADFPGNVIRRWRAGTDGQRMIGPARLRFEVSGGRDAGKEDILGEFFEIKYALGRNSRWSGIAQAQNLSQAVNFSSRDSDTSVKLGLAYNFSANYNIQFVVSRDLNTVFGKEDTWFGVLFYAQKGGGLFDW